MNDERKAETMRLFLAVDPSPDCLTQFAREMDRLRVMAPRARWVRAEKLHVTLVFLGEVEENKILAITDAMRSAAENHAPFVLQFAGGGTFGERKRARVLWAGIGGDLPALNELQKDLATRLEPLGYKPEHREYAPHLTLARAGVPSGDEKLVTCAEALEKQSFGETTIGEVILYRSEPAARGGGYTPLFRAPLRA